MFSSRLSISRPLNMNMIIPKTINKEVKPDGSTTYQLLAITDMDKSGKAGDFKWRAVVRPGELTISADKTKVNVKWLNGLDTNQSGRPANAGLPDFY
ncbi:hypothetical protein Aduo_011516 [Ancylostoma duodenale]